MKKLVALVAAAAVFGWVGAATTLVVPGPAYACGGLDTSDCGDGGSGGGGGGTPPSDPTQYADYDTPSMSCSVYANGSGMGSYCVTAGGGTVQSLRQRFPRETLQRCRYSPLPAGIEPPFNANPGEGRYMLMTCLENIDLDTWNGGPDRGLSIQVVWVPNGTDVSDHHNGITDYLWNQIHAGAHLPVPFMRTKPNVTPLVGIPTYFTFRWLDPDSHQVVAEGPYAHRTDGGPLRVITTNGLVMRAEATKIVVDPNQKGIPSTTCQPDTPYRAGARPSQQPAGACSITFPRSSASARKYATKPIPANVDDAYYVSVTVTWRITYGRTGAMKQLGNGFRMRLTQVLPVQEVQAPNQPPSVIY